jgi:hypothetical protein
VSEWIGIILRLAAPLTVDPPVARKTVSAVFTSGFPRYHEKFSAKGSLSSCIQGRTVSVVRSAPKGIRCLHHRQGCHVFLGGTGPLLASSHNWTDQFLRNTVCNSGQASEERRARAAQDTPMMRALGLAHHWQRMLEERRVASVAEIARMEDVDTSQVHRLMRLILLASEVVERLAGQPDITVEKVLGNPWPYGWHEQARLLAWQSAS